MEATINETLAEAMEAYKPEIAARYVANVERLFAEIVTALGPSLKGVYSSWTWAKPFKNIVEMYVVRGAGEKPWEVGPASLDGDRLAADSAAYAERVAEEWADKINAKMGELETAEVHRLTGTGFVINGTRGGRKVAIEQTMILNVSARGTLFNQWPSRIYVDGKFTSEAAYKRMFA